MVLTSTKSPKTDLLNSRCYQTKNSGAFIVRPAQATDSSSIESNINAICAETVYLHTESLVRTPDWEAMLNQSVDLEARRVLLVAVVGEEIVGHGKLSPPWFGAKGRHVANLGLAIVRGWREIGIGTALLDNLLDWAIYLDYTRAGAEVVASNQRAVGLFRKFGFAEEGRRPDYLYFSSRFHDELLMGRELLSNREEHISGLITGGFVTYGLT